ncbi:hypothetical protein RYH80_14650 [Halobaculum sp. MBLA0147]|uniref:hypothetical protein n=1 Tax=Halobaculum sp. MBLA0147 TaxID=3079934 RepID=UPI00352418B7
MYSHVAAGARRGTVVCARDDWFLVVRETTESLREGHERVTATVEDATPSRQLYQNVPPTTHS